MAGRSRSRFVSFSRPRLVGAIVVALVAAACSGGVGRPSRTTLPPSTTTAPPVRTVADLQPTQASIGDPVAGDLGNGGYDVAAYDVALDWNAETGRIVATAVIQAEATEELDSFNLDLESFIITSATVDGDPAATERTRSELTITPSTPIAAGSAFVTEIAYEGTPRSRRSELARHTVGWTINEDGTSFVSPDPDGSQMWVPVNNHPLDRAEWTIELTVPNPMTAIASGSLGREIRGVGVTTYRWETSRPIGPHVMTLALGEHSVVRDETESPATGVAFRHFLPPHLAASPPAVLGRLSGMVEFLEQRFGPFPYDEYGVAVIDTDDPPALPGNTWSILTPEQLDDDQIELRLIADLARHWFGDDVTPRTWSEVWLSTAIPLYASWMWLEEQRGTQSLGVVARAARSEVKQSAWPAPNEPVVGDLYGDSAFIYGAVYLHALRLKIGDRAFFDLLRTLHADHRGGGMSTSDLVNATYDVSRQNLGYFIDAWFAADPLPGFPDS